MTLLIALIIALPSLLTFCFALEVFIGLRSGPRRKVASPDASQFVIVIPAHNEEAGLGTRLADLAQSVGERGQILVVADNCTDATADVARRRHVKVIERCDPTKRGKGFALDFARQYLRNDPPAYVIILDADCVVEKAAINNLIADCAIANRPCQSKYLMRPDQNTTPNVQLSNFAFYVKNAIRQRGLERLSGRANLVGTGMAFPWPLFDRSALATDNIVEDLEMGLELAASGFPPKLVDDAVVWSDAATQSNTFDQRRRWEGGYLQSAIRWAPRLLARSLRSQGVRESWAAISLLIPPFALLLSADAIIFVSSIFTTRFSHANPWPSLFLGASIFTAVGSLSAAWVMGGSRFVSLGALWRAPIYLLWKIPLYLGLARRGAPKEWLRTGRG